MHIVEEICTQPVAKELIENHQGSTKAIRPAVKPLREDFTWKIRNYLLATLKTRHFLIMLFIAPLISSGCSSLHVNVKPGSLNHMITASPDGNAHQIESKNYINFLPGIEDISETIEVSPIKNEYQEHIERVFANFDSKQESSDKEMDIMIFIHGGLNTLEDSVNRVNEQYPAILKDDTYPIFVNWRSGPFTSYWDHLTRIRDGRSRPVNGAITAPFYFLTDFFGAFSKIPEAWVEQGGDAVADTLARNDEEIRPLIAQNTSIKHVHSESFDRPVSDSILKGGVWAITSPAKLITTSAAYSFGKPTWDIMVRRSRELLIRSCEFYDDADGCNESLATGEKSEDIYKLYGVSNRQELDASDAKGNICKTDAESPVCSGTLSVLLKKLNTRIKNCPGNNSRICESKITLVGHSMGALVIADVLKHFPHIKFDNIVFMGAAVSSREALGSLVPYMQMKDHKETQFYNLSLHPHAEDTEQNMAGAVPNGSLLTWIDSMYGLPENEMDRTFGQWINARRVARHIPVDLADRFHFRIFGFDEDEGPQTHGDFDNIEYEYWNEKFWGVGLY